MPDLWTGAPMGGGWVDDGRGEGCIIPSMTILVGLIENNDVILCTDGFAKDENGTVLAQDQVKSIRMSDSCALAFSGESRWIARVLAGVLGVDIYKDADVNKLINELNKKPVGAGEFDPSDVFLEVQNTVNETINSMKPEWGTENPIFTVLMAGELKGTPLLCSWREGNGWSGDVTFQTGRLPALILEPPGELDSEDKDEIRRVIRKPKTSLRDRLRSVLELCSDQFPSLCNHQGSYRTLRTGFRARPIRPRDKF